MPGPDAAQESSDLPQPGTGSRLERPSKVIAAGVKSDKAREALSFLESLQPSLDQPSNSPLPPQGTPLERPQPWSTTSAQRKDRAAEALRNLGIHSKESELESKPVSEPSHHSANRDHEPVSSARGTPTSLLPGTPPSVTGIGKSFLSFSEKALSSFTTNLRSVASASPEYAARLKGIGSQMLETIAPPISEDAEADQQMKRATENEERQHEIVASPAARDAPRICLSVRTTASETASPLPYPAPLENCLLLSTIRRSLRSNHMLSAVFRSLAIRDIVQRINPDSKVRADVEDGITRLIRSGEHPKVLVAATQTGEKFVVQMGERKPSDDLVGLVRGVASGLGERLVKQGQAMSSLAMNSMSLAGNDVAGSHSQTPDEHGRLGTPSSVEMQRVSSWNDIFSASHNSSTIKVEVSYAFEESLRNSSLDPKGMLDTLEDHVPSVKAEVLIGFWLVAGINRLVVSAKLSSAMPSIASTEVSGTVRPDHISGLAEGDGSSRNPLLVIAPRVSAELVRATEEFAKGSPAILLREGKLAEVVATLTERVISHDISLLEVQGPVTPVNGKIGG